MPVVSDVMTTDPFTAAPDTPINEVAEAMVRGRFGSALIMTGSMLVGIFTERDVLRATAAGDDPSSTPASKWMTPDPATAPPDQDTGAAAELMIGQGFRHLPIVDGTNVMGVVSLRDLFSARVGR